MSTMKGSILFTHSYFYKLDAKQWRFKQPYPPLATILAAAVMREAGFDVSLWDAALKDSPSGIVDAIREHKPQYLVIYDDGFNYLTKMCLTVMREAAFEMAKIGKSLGCTVIVSSSDATDHTEKYFEKHVDFVIKGEGEETLRELIEALSQQKNTREIAGLSYQRDSEVVNTRPRSVMRDLDTLPIPAWDMVHVESYRAIWKKHHGYFSMNIATTRGCPYKCNWCAKPIYGNRYTSRSPQHVAREIEYLLTNFQPDHFWMCDDIFGLKPGWVENFRDETQRMGLRFRYKIQSRVDLLTDEDTVLALAQSGAETIWVGAESGSQKILDAMDKGTTVQQVYDSTALLKKHEIKVALFLQFGYLGETQGDIDATLKMVLDIMPDEVGISVSYPLPGTKFYENVKEHLKTKQNWSDSDDLAMMFAGTFNSAYYKVLHRYVHSVYRKRKNINHLKKLRVHPARLTYRDIRSGMAALYFTAQEKVLNGRLRKLSHLSSTPL